MLRCFLLLSICQALSAAFISRVSCLRSDFPPVPTIVITAETTCDAGGSSVVYPELGYMPSRASAWMEASPGYLGVATKTMAVAQWVFIGTRVVADAAISDVLTFSRAGTLRLTTSTHIDYVLGYTLPPSTTEYVVQSGVGVPIQFGHSQGDYDGYELTWRTHILSIGLYDSNGRLLGGYNWTSAEGYQDYYAFSYGEDEPLTPDDVAAPEPSSVLLAASGLLLQRAIGSGRRG